MSQNTDSAKPKRTAASLKTVFAPPLAVWLCCSLLIALGTVLKTMTFNITLGGVLLSRLGFHLLVVYLAAILFGPFMGALTGVFTDIISMLIFPTGGGYNPLYTLTFVVAGVCAWAVYRALAVLNDTGRKWGWKHILRVFLTVSAVQAVFLFLNTLWIAIFSGSLGAYWTLLAGRCTSLVFYLPVFTVLLCILVPVLKPLSCRLYRH